jgi:ubiquinone biosynthesis protein
MRLAALEHARDLGRMGEISAVFAKHGLGDLLRRAGLGPFVERAGSALRWRSVEDLGTRLPQERLRAAFEQLGPCFVKLGQLLAGRSDLLPPEWALELSRLREDVAPVPFEELRAQLEEDLGADPRQVFRAFDTSPLAAGSIAQVHRAELEDGTAVVLKIRRPGVQEAVEADLRLLARLAERLEQQREWRSYRPRTVVRQFARVLRAELDLAREARHAERLRAALRDDGRIVVPRIHGRWTRERLCVMDHLEGPSLGTWIRDGMPGGPDPAHVARVGTDAILRMVFVAGVYHSDPHAGNVILLPDGRLGLIDFGQIGVLTSARRGEFLELLAAVVARRPDEAADVLLGWADGAHDSEFLEQDCAEFIDRFRACSLRELRAGDVVAAIHALARENHLLLPADVSLLLKLFLTLDGLGRALDPGFVVSAYVEPFVRRQGGARPVGLRELPGLAADLARLAAGLPRDLRGLRNRLRRGRIGVQLDLPGLERFAAQLDHSVNHLTMGMIVSALIVGTSVSMTISVGPRLWGIPLFGVVGFASSIVVGLGWLAATRRRP